jgi:uncharacterized membrane protein
MSMTTEQGGGARTRGGTAVSGAPEDARHVHPPARQDAESAANFLGWFSVGLGVAELVAPQALSQLIGVKPTRRNRAVMQAMGVREVVKGVGILANDRPRDWMWGRVAGDVLDLALLGRAMTTHSEKKERTASAIGAVIGVAAMDLLTAQALSAGPRITRHQTESGRTRVHKTVTVMKEPEEVFAFFSDLSNHARFMRHVESVRAVEGDRWRYTVRLGDDTLEFDAEVTEQRPGERIAWRSMEGSPMRMDAAIEIRRAPGDRGTEVTGEMDYSPPLGLLGATVARLFREEPEQRLNDELKRAKQLMEVGEVTVSDATLERGMRPAQPSEERFHGSVQPASSL